MTNAAVIQSRLDEYMTLYSRVKKSGSDEVAIALIEQAGKGLPDDAHAAPVGSTA